MSAKRKIEIFSAGCPVCQEAILSHIDLQKYIYHDKGKNRRGQDGLKS